MSDEGFFKINQDTEFKFKDSYGFTFVFEENILRINEKISSAELKPVGIIYEENDEYYFAPLDEVGDIKAIINEFMKRCSA
ncbi:MULTISPECIES: hypothetical protein [unclassified Methanobrevibacter]|jgi:hypothetical protein|uniref:hypothetical protein n=1 Tax=unclassified Methanobrevibacter TaxID=2638681 RepID=UPI0025F833A7|nr:MULTISPECIES: hypothetical protein [unclassified Methanobrevibacter]MEE0942587.1 hypothetical protein [Methanobrevibacter sp.]